MSAPPQPHWWDFLFGQGALKQAAGQPAPAAPVNPPNAQSDMAKQAQAYADQRAAQAIPPTSIPPSVPAGALTKAAQKKREK